MAIEFNDVLDSTQADPNVTNAVKRQGGLEISDTTGLQDALDDKSNVGHTHTVSDVTDFPATMPPSAHTHPTSDISDWPSTFPPSAHTHPWGDVTGKPTEYPPAAHTHSQYELTLGNPAENNQVKLYQADGSMSYVDLPAGGSNPVWGDIGGTLSNQTDLQAALDAKSDTGHSHTLADISDAGTMAAQDDVPSDGVAYARQDATWVPVPAGGTVEWGDIQGDITAQTDLMAELDTKLEDAPSDGNQYARQDGSWSVVTGGGGGIPEAPEDGDIYGRQNASWVPIPSGGTVEWGGIIGDIFSQTDLVDEFVCDNRTIVDENTDWNDLNRVGTYRVNNCDGPNAPADITAYGSVTIFKGSDDGGYPRIIQWYIPAGAGNFAMREFYNDIWGAWKHYTGEAAEIEVVSSGPVPDGYEEVPVSEIMFVRKVNNG